MKRTSNFPRRRSSDVNRPLVPTRRASEATRRRGTTLLELMAAVVGVTIVLGLISLAWHSLGRIQRRGEESFQATRQVQRLALRFRQDAHESIDGTFFETEPGSDRPTAPIRAGAQLKRSDGRVVEFRQADGGVERRVLHGEQVEHRELYRLPPTLRATPSYGKFDGRGEASLAFQSVPYETPVGADANRRRADSQPTASTANTTTDEPIWLRIKARSGADGGMP